MTIEAGQLRHRVAVQNATEVRNTHGEPIRTWATAVTVWAAIDPINGRELLLAKQVASETTHRIRMRYHAEVTSASRLLYGSRTFQIDSVLNRDERNAEMELLCHEVVV